MRSSICIAALGAVFAIALAGAASAQLGGGKGHAGAMAGPPRVGASPGASVTCTVGAVETQGLAFSCGGQSFRVCSPTEFQLGSAGTSFSGLQPGMNVQIRYHGVSDGMVADSVKVTQ